MALKDTWKDLSDSTTGYDGDDASAEPINDIAHAVIELEEELEGGGADGLSAYEIAVKNGFEGTEEEWLASLHGEDGYTPVKGVDYFTEDDKAEIVNDVLAALPDGDEVSY